MAPLQTLRFAIPASAGPGSSSAALLREYLAAKLAGRFELLSDRAQLGWAPPIVAARVELSGEG